jgi:Dyp-type peroxidase family
MRRLSEVVASAADPEEPGRDTWVSVSVTYRGLQALGVPRDSLDSFPLPFREGMAARASKLGDVGESHPDRWEPPLGSGDVHVVLTAIAPDSLRLDAALARARSAYEKLSGVTAIWRQDCHVLPDEKEPFGFKDGISHPAIEGSGIPASNPSEPPLKAGEFVLGYPDEMSDSPAIPRPDVLGRNGSFVAFRKLHQRVAAFRRYLRENACDAGDEELLAAKMMGRWRSGAPLALCPMHDDAAVGADPARNNAFLFKADDAIGYRTPPGSHIRRMNPRDTAHNIQRRRMIRRGGTYGPHLPDDAPDDGVERGIAAFVGCASLARQFEFTMNVWVNDPEFHELGNERDPFVGTHDGTFDYAIPRRPIKKVIKGLPAFTTVKGGAYFFLPGIEALRFLASGGKDAR